MEKSWLLHAVEDPFASTVIKLVTLMESQDGYI